MSGAQDMPTKMDTLVRVAAEALWESETDSMEDGWDTSLRCDKLCIDGEFQLRPVVRAILTALRSPTEGMIDAALKTGALDHSDEYPTPDDMMARSAEYLWQTMIDSVLKEDK